MRLTFLGAAGEVTGSCFLIETPQVRFLVDCGMFQGGREADRKNREAFDCGPETIDFVLLTHAHIDHSGLLPRLAMLGFRGPIYTTAATADLLAVMLKDSAYIQEKEAEWQIRSADYDEEILPHPSVRCVFRDAGHILGSAIIELGLTSGNRHRKLVFSGDLGQPGHPVIKDPAPVHQADVLLLESTYGNRLHRNMADTLDELVHAINDTLLRKGGNIIVPAFTVGRTQDLLFLLIDLYRQGKIGEMDIYVDSPMALAATEITLKHTRLLDEEMSDAMKWLRHNSGKPRIHFVQSVEESMRLNSIRKGAVIISASGMCDAGRIKYHLKYNLGRPECSILITGFQAVGTLGRRLVDGVRSVKIFNENVPVRAEIYTIGGLSAHADQADLLAWLSHFDPPPARTFLVHGEPSICAILADAIRQKLNWNASIPVQSATVEI
ncbi:MBL fold metallo-hydrolase RNA specificity domain-containing protein [Nitrosospira multiformis]|nr:MBL fold metallo-hydrolase [Nitrosospira multiformis]